MGVYLCSKLLITSQFFAKCITFLRLTKTLRILWIASDNLNDLVRSKLFKLISTQYQQEMIMALDAHEFMKKMANRINFTDADKMLLKSEANWGKQIAPEMAEYFYAYLSRDSEMYSILNAKEGRLHRLHETFIQWFHEMFTGIDDWGDAYADRRWRIGLVHVQVGIFPQHVVPAMAIVVQEVSNQIKKDGKNEAIREALGRICMIDLAFIEQAYVEVSAAAVLQETGWTENLFRRMIASGVGSM